MGDVKCDAYIKGEVCTKSPPRQTKSYLQLIPVWKWKSSFFQGSVTGDQPHHEPDPWPGVTGQQKTNPVFLCVLFALVWFHTYCLTVFLFLDLFLFQFCGVSFLRVRKNIKLGW